MKNQSPTLHWSHGPKEWDALVCQPEHPLSPVLAVTRRGYDARVTITCCEPGSDEELTIADVVVPHRNDLFDCSVCNGVGQTIAATGSIECQWCRGLQRTAMDEGKEIACALYWSWLRSPNGGLVREQSVPEER